MIELLSLFTLKKVYMKLVSDQVKCFVSMSRVSLNYLTKQKTNTVSQIKQGFLMEVLCCKQITDYS